jgi:hypothetical protein
MSLLSKLREKQATKIATATFATQVSAKGRAVAIVATVDVARSLQVQITATAKASVADAANSSSWWKVHYPDRDPVTVSCYPPVTHTEILMRYGGAVAVERFARIIRQASTPFTANEEMAIRAWLLLIEETDPSVIGEVIAQCQQDAIARDYFSARALAELPKPSVFADDRRTCDQCTNLKGLRCQAAKRGEINASRNFEPIRDLPQRCEGYTPYGEDPDRRPGRERWSKRIHNGGE